MTTDWVPVLICGWGAVLFVGWLALSEVGIRREKAGRLPIANAGLRSVGLWSHFFTLAIGALGGAFLFGIIAEFTHSTALFWPCLIAGALIMHRLFAGLFIRDM